MGLWENIGKVYSNAAKWLDNNLLGAKYVAARDLRQKEKEVYSKAVNLRQ